MRRASVSGLRSTCMVILICPIQVNRVLAETREEHGKLNLHESASILPAQKPGISIPGNNNRRVCGPRVSSAEGLQMKFPEDGQAKNLRDHLIARRKFFHGYRLANKQRKSKSRNSERKRTGVFSSFQRAASWCTMASTPISGPPRASRFNPGRHRGRLHSHQGQAWA
jgi:hypothetical protein